MTRADLLQLLAIASAAPSMAWPDDEHLLPGSRRRPTPDEWAAHLMVHALALDRAIGAKLGADEHAAEEVARIAAVAADVDHLNECAPDHCAAGCPDALRKTHEEIAQERKLHGECCAYCHGTGSDRTCPKTEYDPADDGDAS